MRSKKYRNKIVQEALRENNNHPVYISYATVSMLYDKSAADMYKSCITRLEDAETKE